MLCCLLLTALLLLALPGLTETLTARDPTRVSDRLRPAKQRTLTVWMIGDRTESLGWVKARLAAYEKAHPGARVYLRSADESELYAENAALPDAALFAALSAPERALLPITGAPDCRADAIAAGRAAGTLYAAPLCYAPSVLAVPTALLPVRENAPPPSAAAPKSYFSFAPATPDPVQPKTTPRPDEIPWAALVERLSAPEGAALQQLSAMCPADARAGLISALAKQWNAGGERKSPVAETAARVLTVAAYRRALAAGEALTGFAMTPAACDRALLCGVTGEDGAALMRWLLSEESQAALAGYGLYPTRPGAPHPAESAAERETSALYASALLLTNAFSHTVKERDALCRSAFTSGNDPVETLLRLR